MLENPQNSSLHVVANASDDEVHFLDVLTVLGQQKKIVIGFTAAGCAIAVAAALLAAPVYISTAVILPPQEQKGGGMAAMLGQLGGLAGAAGSIAGLKNPNDMYVGMLQSQTVGDAVIKKFDLQKHYKTETMFATRKQLAKNSNMVSGKDGLISIIVEDSNPEKASEMANEFVSQLAAVTRKLAVTEAAKRRVFFESQLKTAKESLASAEVVLQDVQKKTGMLQLDGQVKGIIANIAQLQAQIAAREVQLNSARTFATSNNPDVVRAQEELRSLRQQLAKLQVGGKVESGNLMVPTAQIPEVGVEYIRSLRDVKYSETMFEMMAKQFELAKVDESKESSLIQQLDIAEPAELKSRPRKTMIVLGGLMVGMLIGVTVAFVRGYYVRSRSSDDSRQRWDRFFASWKN